MIEEGRIKKVIASDNERLCIQMEEISGQAFVYARDANSKETAISVVTDTGIIQDIQLSFQDKPPEVVVLKDATLEKEEKCEKSQNPALLCVQAIMSGNVPCGYTPCSMGKGKWYPKKDIALEPIMKLEGTDDFLYVYRATNLLKQSHTLIECELECKGSRWIFLESNILKPKQTILSVISVAKYE
jgi:hypothetical protein